MKGTWAQGHNLRVSNPMLGKASWNKGKTGIYNEEQLQKIRDARAKQVFTTESQLKKSESLKQAYKEGSRKVEDLAWYIDGRHAGKTPIKQSYEYKLWRKSVFERDNYTCQMCKQRGGELQADHIKPQSIYPELRLDLDNGRTLCRPCHQTTDTWGLRITNNKKNTTNICVGTQS